MQLGMRAVLSFVYALVLAKVLGAVEGVGLDRQIGFLHDPRPGHASPGLDLSEELRPSVADRFVVGLFSRKNLTAEDFLTTPEGACYLTDDGRKKLIQAHENHGTAEVEHPLLDRKMPRAALTVVQATLLARHLREGLPAYPPYVMAG
ncbi:MAG: CRISPR-associated endonuclease Cas1 [Candidatus Dormibacteria bacterium]